MIVEFLQDLFDHGNVRVGHPDDAIDEEEWSRASEVLKEFESIRKCEMPGEPPTFDVTAARWAAWKLYRACQAGVYRDLPAESLQAFLEVPPPAAEGAALHYSVDLVFQFLPDVIKMASHIAAGDPLVAILHEWANQFPLSSVGIKEVTPESTNVVLDHRTLRRYYVDRVIARRDTSRLADPPMQREVQRALGIHGPMFPEFATVQK